MTISTGGYAAIAIVSVLFAAGLVVGGIYARKVYRRRKERRHAHIPARDYYLDFGSDDWENGSTVPVYAASMVESFEALSTTGIRPMSRFLSSEVSLVGVPSMKSASQEGLPNPFETTRPASPARPVPILKEPIPPVKPMTPSSLMTAEHQLHSLVSRPAFLTEPRPAPRPSPRQRGTRESPESRSSGLTRLPSTRAKKTARIMDTVEEPESPESIYSQSSAAPSSLHLTAYYASNDTSRAPPLPPVPEKYQSLHSNVTERRPRPTPVSTPPTGLRYSKNLPPLEDSYAFPLPAPNSREASPRSPNSQWLSRSLWQSSAVTSSPYSSNDVVVPNPAYDDTSDLVSENSFEVSYGTPQYDLVASPSRKARCGKVGYQPPSNWRRDQKFSAMSSRDT
ncbi:hypothetical protein PHLGIDRAFT_350870 [Phlebiopsis gigantea 11061_1 CR5-6]|uniref:Uncharacterized protein n=1 Tax=Phlebiopsis gigantea (strain 11061_1 CR5-6) TaxID=745531 RepID=A0A0C3NUL1_PHLG1|nr:hypothetical protein PHLGIDRAFT_350870 [Phlebiopsis gigantea 11061_1 CR5-6]